MERALYDITNPETGAVNTVAMTLEEAIRCTQDLEFSMQIIAGQKATSLESITSETAVSITGMTSEAAIDTIDEAAAPDSISVTEDLADRVSTETESEAIPSVTDHETPGNTIYRWRENNINLLLNTYEEMKDKFADPKISQKKAWIMVAEEANKQNKHFNVTAPQCMTKKRALKKIYKNIKDHNSKSGNDRKTWKYYEKMHEIFGMKAWATPIALVSSDQPPSISTSAEAQANRTTGQSSYSKSTRSKDKNTVIELLKAKIEQRERHEDARQKRHEERLASDQELIKTIKGIF